MIMTRILIIYKDNLLTATTTAAVFLSLGRGEDVAFGSTLDTIHVIVRMENGDTSHHGEKNWAVHLANRETIQTNERNENKLHDGDSGEIGHLETVREGFSFGGRFGVSDYHRLLLVSGHFYYLLRK